MQVKRVLHRLIERRSDISLLKGPLGQPSLLSLLDCIFYFPSYTDSRITPGSMQGPSIAPQGGASQLNRYLSQSHTRIGSAMIG